MNSDNIVSGSCLCGAVRYDADLPSLFCAHCHCCYCRRAHGAAFVTWFGVKEEQFRLVMGADALHWYDSSKQSQRGFCQICGTTLFFRTKVSPGEMHIALATVEGAIDRAPQAHCFSDQRVPWVALDDDLPQLGSESPELAHYKTVGQ